MSSAVPSRALLGITLALSSAVAFALANAFAGLAYHGGSNPLTVAACRFVLPTVVLVAWLRMRDVPLALPGRDGWIAAALGAVTALYSWALLASIGAIPLALVILIFYLFPLVAAVILAVCGWARLTWQTIVATVVALAGLALALDPGGGHLNVAGITLAVVGAVGLGIVVAVSSRVFRAGDSRPVTLYMAAVAGVLLLAFCVLHRDFALPQTGLGWIGFAGTAVFYAFAMIAFFVAVSMIGPVRVSLLCYAEPVVSAALGVTVLGQALAPLQVVGIAIVIVALIGSTLWRPSAG